MPTAEHHRSHRGGWLRAAVMGASDGIVSTASLVLGVAAASVETSEVLTAGVAGLVAGALSMAAGEYVSVASQRDAQHADLELERDALRSMPREETDELAQIYVARGLDPELARQVAGALMQKDALRAHARDELHMDPDSLARPLLAAVASSASFAVGALVPLLGIWLSAADLRLPLTVCSSLAALAGLGAWSAALSGASVRRAALRVLVGGAGAMAITAGVGRIAGELLVR